MCGARFATCSCVHKHIVWTIDLITFFYINMHLNDKANGNSIKL